MEERQRPQAPHIVLFVKTHNSPTFDTLISFLHDLDKVLSTVRVPCFSMRTTPSHFVRKNTIHNFGPRDYAVVSSGGLRTLWPLATDFFMPAGTFSQGISILNDKLANQLSQRAVARLAGAYQSANADAIAECLVNIAPGAPIQAWRALQQLQQADGVAAVSTRLEAIMHGLALQDTQRLQQRVEQQQLHHRSLEATCLQYREQCERQHTELQGSVAEVRRAIAAERSSLSQLQREKEAVVARRRSVVQDLVSAESSWVQRFESLCKEVETLERSVQEKVWELTDRASARDERVKALRQLLSDMQQLHCACQKLDSQQTVFEGVQARRLALVAEESSLEVSIDELFVRLQARAREIGYNVVVNKL
ncbi:hypothetical protein JKP88DRAFT_227942 [Tribonema minus]|uniref:Uncharacterized protein n=1 Tax=Tribonema minus TaxID=303371 RepID=A0A835YJ86_9STRA|nr:hypothetical protein JKP88DRAFT_227933 [Tribonema minus]KAG5176180.1 hypothetical protein JKP88DRAFT_227942 [Tribonema minus]